MSLQSQDQVEQAHARRAEDKQCAQISGPRLVAFGIDPTEAIQNPLGPPMSGVSEHMGHVVAQRDVRRSQQDDNDERGDHNALPRSAAMRGRGPHPMRIDRPTGRTHIAVQPSGMGHQREQDPDRSAYRLHGGAEPQHPADASTVGGYALRLTRQVRGGRSIPTAASPPS